MKTYTIEEASGALSVVAREAYDHEPVVLVDGARLLILQPYIPPTPLEWTPPPNYFSNIYSQEEIDLDNQMAKASVQHLDEEDH